MRLQGKVAYITGAAGGIGKATARRFVDDGAQVALLDFNENALGEVARALGAAAKAYQCDVSDEASVTAATDAVEADFGRIDIGVLNAGIAGNRQNLQDIDTASFDRTLAVNARGVFLGMKHLFPALRRAGAGAIVVMSSTEGLRGNAGLSPYVASKHAVVGLMRTAALEWARYGIRVNCVNPGPVDTELMRDVERRQMEIGVADIRERNVSRIPMQRYADPRDVASLIAFLASPEAAYLTGGTYLADGGIMAGKMAES